jgi:hypothetical protein
LWFLAYTGDFGKKRLGRAKLTIRQEQEAGVGGRKPQRDVLNSVFGKKLSTDYADYFQRWRLEWCECFLTVEE